MAAECRNFVFSVPSMQLSTQWVSCQWLWKRNKRLQFGQKTGLFIISRPVVHTVEHGTKPQLLNLWLLACFFHRIIRQNKMNTELLFEEDCTHCFLSTPLRIRLGIPRASSPKCPRNWLLLKLLKEKIAMSSLNALCTYKKMQPIMGTQ